MRRRYDVAQLVAILTVMGMLVAAGMWLGALQNRVVNLEEKERYVHGTFSVPKEK